MNSNLKITKKPNRSMSKFVLHIKAITYSLLSEGDLISEQDHIFVILYGLSKEYNPFMMRVYDCPKPSTIYDCEALLDVQEAQLDKIKK